MYPGYTAKVKPSRFKRLNTIGIVVALYILSRGPKVQLGRHMPITEPTIGDLVLSSALI
jgi:hypothetical protein